LKFLVDAQLPPVLAAWLRAQGHDARHVDDLDLLRAPDTEIWDYAISSNCVVMTKDHDFAEWARSRQPAAPVVWLRFGNMTNLRLLTRLTSAWPELIERLESGAMIVEAGRR
jgi:predicted nuclease of predicted toxin-antitoxin system